MYAQKRCAEITKQEQQEVNGMDGGDSYGRSKKSGIQIKSRKRQRSLSFIFDTFLRCNIVGNQI